jgi:hypothetical protein
MTVNENKRVTGTRLNEGTKRIYPYAPTRPLLLLVLFGLFGLLAFRVVCSSVIT